MKTTCSSLFITLLITVTLFGCTDKNREATLVTSVEPQAAILQEIVGNRHTVVALLGSGANPETFEPTVATRMTAEKSPAIFVTGVLPFEQELVAKLGNANVVDTSKGIELLYGTHGHDHGHNTHDGNMHNEHQSLPDPHIWVSVRNARIIAANMLEAITRLEPENAEYYTANFQRLDARLDSLDRAFSNSLSALPRQNKTFAVWHPSLSYFARDYNLEQLAVGFENKEISPARLANVVDEAREHNIRVLFYQPGIDSRQTATLNEAIGSEMIEINPMLPDWENQLTIAANALTR